MENRFGFKDLVLSVLILLLVCVVVLGMKQLDRQWVLLNTIQEQGKQQTELLAAISRSLDDLTSSGTSVARGPSTQSASSQPNPGAFFAPLKEAKAMPDFASGDFLVDNLQTKLGGTLTPFISHDLYSYWIQTKVLDSLLAQDPNTLEYIPEVARDWQVTPDGLKYTFQLRRGVRFSDGHPLTADDVVFTYKFIMNPKINAPSSRSYFEKVESVEKTNDYEVVFTMSEPYFNTLNVLGTNLYILPKHFYSQFGEEEVNQNPGLLMGSGPYRMPDPKSWRPGKQVALVRNEVYWGEAPAFDRLIFDEVEEEAAQETMFRNGELDVYRCLAPQFDRLSKDPTVTSRATGYAIDSFLNGYYFIAWNQRRGGKSTPMADRRVRTALSLMTDREGICRQVYLGYAKPIAGPFWIGSPQADPALKPLPYNPPAAQALLAQAGYADRDGSGVFKSANGTPLRFKLTYPTGSEFVQRVVLFLKDNYAKAGVAMEPDPQQWAVLNERLQHRDFDAVYMGWGGGDVEQDLYQEFDSSQMEGAGDDFMSYKNPELDRVIREARRTIDREKRMKLWQQADRILYEDQPYTFMYTRQELRFIVNRVHNVKRTKAELNVVDLWTNPIPWYVPKPLQKYTAR